ncbi:NADPH-dependent FMN reductase [Phenylobacterium montanum]|uniref:NAD(P)H-dependent oxidoreductase n=1 Tax=Phenylobacterium montanum TaxID=2823693 RepID=A0A975FZZ4_9CAUL|nr:NAD(P)H-dependent oxidoreductase [Caulobacter sp. S6]QUD88027.1 NAD(P)H-dependent oxidoreductase [Caulobacter sp. S6]
MPAEIRVLAISGSLRAASSNSVLIRAAAQVAPPGVVFDLFEGLADLPHFSPDLDEAGAPAVVQAFRRRLAAADAILICSPEYAHGVPGSLKNALDWIVSSGEMVDKPAGLINASARATIAQASLVDTVGMLSAVVVEAASPVIPMTGRDLDEAGLIADPVLGPALRAAVAALAAAARK